MNNLTKNYIGDYNPTDFFTTENHKTNSKMPNVDNSIKLDSITIFEPSISENSESQRHYFKTFGKKEKIYYVPYSSSKDTIIDFLEEDNSNIKTNDISYLEKNKSDKSTNIVNPLFKPEIIIDNKEKKTQDNFVPIEGFSIIALFFILLLHIYKCVYFFIWNYKKSLFYFYTVDIIFIIAYSCVLLHGFVCKWKDCRSGSIIYFKNSIFILTTIIFIDILLIPYFFYVFKITFC